MPVAPAGATQTAAQASTLTTASHGREEHSILYIIILHIVHGLVDRAHAARTHLTLNAGAGGSTHEHHTGGTITAAHGRGGLRDAVEPCFVAKEAGQPHRMQHALVQVGVAVMG
jgi:hypothetical protein